MSEIMENEASRLAEPVFLQEGWTYFDSPEVPTRSRMESLLRELVYKVRSGSVESRSGHFVVRRDQFEDDRIEILLALTAEDDE